VFGPYVAAEVPSLQLQALAVLRTAFPAHWRAAVRKCLGFDTAEVRARLAQLRRCTAGGGHWTAMPLTGRPRRRCMGFADRLPDLAAHDDSWLDGVAAHKRCPRHWHREYDRFPIYFLLHTPGMIYCALRDPLVTAFADGEVYSVHGMDVAYVPLATHHHRQAGRAPKRARSPSPPAARARAPQT